MWNSDPGYSASPLTRLLASGSGAWEPQGVGVVSTCTLPRLGGLCYGLVVLVLRHGVVHPFHSFGGLRELALSLKIRNEAA